MDISVSEPVPTWARLRRAPLLVVIADLEYRIHRIIC
jgi:hypothetical protein